jgi:hypothetical protein
VFRLLALEEGLDVTPGADYQQFHDATPGRELAHGVLVGTYGR